MPDEVAGPWDRLIEIADYWDSHEPKDRVTPGTAGVCDPLAWLLRRQAARSAMDYHRLLGQGVPRKIAVMVIESDSDFMAADAAATALSTLLR